MTSERHAVLSVTLPACAPVGAQEFRMLICGAAANPAHGPILQSRPSQTAWAPDTAVKENLFSCHTVGYSF